MIIKGFPFKGISKSFINGFEYNFMVSMEINPFTGNHSIYVGMKTSQYSVREEPFFFAYHGDEGREFKEHIMGRCELDYSNKSFSEEVYKTIKENVELLDFLLKVVGVTEGDI